MRPGQSPDLPSQNLTWRQRKIVRVIRESERRHGFGPTVREIADAVGLASASSADYQLKRLEEKGLVTRSKGRARAIVLRVPPDPPLRMRTGRALQAAARPGLAQVPLVGRIAAGDQILATEMFEDVIPLPRQLTGEGDFILLRVAGDSMIDAAIADGDLVVVRKESDVENGDIVAAMIENEGSGDYEATVKTFARRDGHVWLIPHNPAYERKMADSAKIIGKVVAVLRRL